MKKIEKIIKQELNSLLIDLDIDSEIERIIGKNHVKDLVAKEIDSIIIQKVTDTIQSSIIKAIQKKQPLIDAYTENKVRSLMISIDKATKNI